MSALDANELPAGWELSTIGDVAVYVQRGKSPKYIEKSDLPVVNQKCVRWDEIQSEHLKFVHPDQWEKWAEERTLQLGDILWNSTGTGTIGRAAVFRGIPGYARVVADSHVTVIRLKEYLPEILHSWIRSPAIQDRIESMQSGSTNQVELSKGEVERTPLPVPPLNEQRRLAEKLDAVLARVDACRERVDRVPAILKRFRQSVLAAATSGKLTEDWREEYDVSDSWVESDIQSVAQVGTGSTPLRSNQSFYGVTGTPWVTSAATSKPVVLSAEEFVTDSAISAHRLKKFPVGTLLVAMYGEGKTRGQVSELGIEATINQACAAVVVDENRAQRAFVKLSLQANYLEMRELAEGGNQPNLNLSKIKEFPLRLPGCDEQLEIVRRVEAIFAHASRIEVQYDTARVQVEKLTPALLAKACRGELVPQDLHDEPASVLLERIRAARGERPTKPKQRKKARRPNMATLSLEAMKAIIERLPADGFTFDELRAQVATDYETLKDVAFELLADSTSGLSQFFDEESSEMRFKRTKT